MKQVRRRTRLAAASALLVLVACAEDATAPLGDVPEPGWLAVTLLSPHEDDGAVLISLRGPHIGEVLPADPGHHLFTADGEEAGERRVAVLGERIADAVVAFEVPDIRHAALYSARLISAADRKNAPRDAVAGYTLRIDPRE